MSNVFRERKEVAAYAALLHERGWVANHDGNVSVRLGGGRLLITPTGISKRLCGPETLVECSPAGEPIGPGKAPSEVGLHVGAYRARSDAAAVIHAHPPHASAYALCQVPLGPIGMPEVVVSLGEQVPMVPLYGPKDAAAAEALGQALGSADVAILAGNGVVAIGPDLETAYLRIELLEHYARILTLARGRVGEPAPMPDALKEKLLDLRKKAGLHRGPINTTSAAPSRGSLQDTLRNVVAEEVRRALGGEVVSRTNVDQLVETIARRVEAEIERQLGRVPQAADLAPCATCKAGVHCEPKRVVGAVNAGAKRIGVEGLLEAAPCGHLAPLIDHTLLKPEATKEELRKVCEEARRFGFATVCVNSANVRFVAACLEGSGVKAIAVVGFPLGAATPSAKAFETREAIPNGAQEIDMVINIGALKSRDLAEAFADIKAVVEAAGRVPVKVILETSKLDHDEKVMACTLSKAAGAAFVKTSTGFGGGGATPEDVALMRKVVGDDIGVKASGGIRTTEDAEKVLAAGASRIGASSSVEIVRCSKPDPKAKATPKGY